MTTPEFPGEGSHQNQPQQPFPTQQNHGSSTQMPPQQTKRKKQTNVVGLIALIAAVIGFIFACIPGALILGWILLPIAFILALVSLFLKDKSKWMGITALILSVVGTIVGVLVFFTVVADSFDEAFSSGDTTVVAPSESSVADESTAEDGTTDDAATEDEGTATDVGTRENPSPIGSAVESDEWRVVINSVDLAATEAVLAANEFNEAPAEGSEYILVNYSVTYLGDGPQGQLPAFTTLEYVTAEGTTVNSFDTLATAPDAIDTISTLYTDATTTGNTVFAVPSATAGDGVLAVQAGLLGDKVFISTR